MLVVFRPRLVLSQTCLMQKLSAAERCAAKVVQKVSKVSQAPES